MTNIVSIYLYIDISDWAFSVVREPQPHSHSHTARSHDKQLISQQNRHSTLDTCAPFVRQSIGQINTCNSTRILFILRVLFLLCYFLYSYLVADSWKHCCSMHFVSAAIQVFNYYYYYYYYHEGSKAMIKTATEKKKKIQRNKLNVQWFWVLGACGQCEWVVCCPIVQVENRRDTQSHNARVCIIGRQRAIPLSAIDSNSGSFVRVTGIVRFLSTRNRYVHSTANGRSGYRGECERVWERVVEVVFFFLSVSCSLHLHWCACEPLVPSRENIDCVLCAESEVFLARPR